MTNDERRKRFFTLLNKEDDNRELLEMTNEEFKDFCKDKAVISATSLPERFWESRHFMVVHFELDREWNHTYYYCPETNDIIKSTYLGYEI